MLMMFPDIILFVNFDVDDLSPLYSDKLRIFF